MKKLNDMKWIFIGMFLSLCSFVNAQEGDRVLSRTTFEGVWQSEKDDRSYFIIKGDYQIGIYLYEDGNVSVNFDRYGFVTESDFEKFRWNNEEGLPLSRVKDEGKYMVVYLKEEYQKNGILDGAIFYGVYIDDGEEYLPGYISLSYNSILNFSRAGYFKEDVERKIIAELKKRGLKMPRTYNYSSWKRFAEIESMKVRIFLKPDTLTKMYLIVGDVVKVNKEEGEWLDIEYWAGKKIIKGWIKKCDVVITEVK